MSNRTLYLFTAGVVLAVTYSLLGAATTAELQHAMLISEAHLLITAAVLLVLLRRTKKNQNGKN